MSDNVSKYEDSYNKQLQELIKKDSEYKPLVEEAKQYKSADDFVNAIQKFSIDGYEG
jgi:non-homologous end joining protein Ku